LSGGNPEWAEEDAAIHAANLANWRIKLLQARKVQSDITRQIMDSVGGATQSSGAKGKGLKKVGRAVSKLAAGTSKAIGSIQKQLDGNKALASKGGSEVNKILKQMDKLASDFRADDSDLSKEDAADVAPGA